MPNWLAPGQAGTEMKKITMPELVRTILSRRSLVLFWVRYKTEIMDAGILMLAFVSLMPMPGYVWDSFPSKYLEKNLCPTITVECTITNHCALIRYYQCREWLYCNIVHVSYYRFVYETTSTTFSPM